MLAQALQVHGCPLRLRALVPCGVKACSHARSVADATALELTLFLSEAGLRAWMSREIEVPVKPVYGCLVL